jgi:hypothetical protein
MAVKTMYKISQFSGTGGHFSKDTQTEVSVKVVPVLENKGEGFKKKYSRSSKVICLFMVYKSSLRSSYNICRYLKW